jgi:CheY-like chemotaxis protein
MMVGMSGLETLSEIKNYDPSIPIVMATKNEEESVMEEAIGRKINDYLTKPINPAQVLLVCKKFLDVGRISKEVFTQDYLAGFAQLSAQMYSPLN